MTNSPYPPMSQWATTFNDLFWAYLTTWPGAYVETYDVTSHEPHLYAARLYRQARTVAEDFPDLELWDFLEPALRHTMRWYALRRGPFDKLFERNLRQRLRKATAREAEKAVRSARRTRRCAQEMHPLPAEHDDVAAAYRRWSLHLLNVVTARLDHRTRVYIEMARRGQSVKAIAEALGLSEKTLSNTLSTPTLVKRVRQRVRRLVVELPDRQRALLGRHLREEAGLSPAQVERLLGVALEADTTVPVLEEEAVLEALGWADQENREVAAAAGSMFYEYGRWSRP